MEHSPAHLAPGKSAEMLHMSDKNLAAMEAIHGYTPHTHISPVKVGRVLVDPLPLKTNLIVTSKLWYQSQEETAPAAPLNVRSAPHVQNGKFTLRCHSAEIKQGRVRRAWSALNDRSSIRRRRCSPRTEVSENHNAAGSCRRWLACKRRPRLHLFGKKGPSFV